MIYDYRDWAGVGNFLAFNCQASQGARGGNCLADTGIYTNVPDFFIQSVHHATCRINLKKGLTKHVHHLGYMGISNIHH